MKPYTVPSPEVIAAAARDLESIAELVQEVRSRLGLQQLEVSVGGYHSSCWMFHGERDETPAVAHFTPPHILGALDSLAKQSHDRAKDAATL